MRFALLLTLLILNATFSVSHAEQKKVLGDWDVHYIVVNSTFFDPAVLKNYQLQRSKYNAILNISVLDADSKQAQSVAIKGTYKDLLGKVKPLAFRQVSEGDAIYYLAQIKFDDKETYRFDIQLQSGNDIQTLKFQNKLYVD